MAVRIQDGSGNNLTSTGNALDINIKTGSVGLPSNAAQETGGNLATVAAAQGTGGTGITEPAGGTGLLGWLSGIYQKLSSSLAVTGTFWQTTQPVSATTLPLPSNAAQETGGNLATVATAQAHLTDGTQKSQLVDALNANLGSNTNPLIVSNQAKAAYRAATATLVAVVAGTAPFFVLYGSATKTLRLQRINISGLTTAMLGIDRINLAKYSTAPTVGTPVVLTQVPLDSNFAAATAALCQVYTAAPTAGTKVGDIASRGILAKSTTVAEGSPFAELVFDFRAVADVGEVVLRGVAQGVALYFNVAPAAVANMQIEVEWTEE